MPTYSARNPRSLTTAILRRCDVLTTIQMRDPTYIPGTLTSMCRYCAVRSLLSLPGVLSSTWNASTESVTTQLYNISSLFAYPGQLKCNRVRCAHHSRKTYLDYILIAERGADERLDLCDYCYIRTSCVSQSMWEHLWWCFFLLICSSYIYNCARLLCIMKMSMNIWWALDLI